MSATHLSADAARPPPAPTHQRTAKIIRVFVSPETKALLIELGAEISSGAGGAGGLILEELAHHGLLEQVWQAQQKRHMAKLARGGTE